LLTASWVLLLTQSKLVREERVQFSSLLSLQETTVSLHRLGRSSQQVAVVVVVKTAQQD